MHKNVCKTLHRQITPMRACPPAFRLKSWDHGSSDLHSFALPLLFFCTRYLGKREIPCERHEQIYNVFNIILYTVVTLCALVSSANFSKFWRYLPTSSLQNQGRS